MPSSASASNADSNVNVNTKELAQALTTMVSDRLDNMQQQLDTAIQQRTDELAQKIQSQSLRQMSLGQRQTSMDSAASNLSTPGTTNNNTTKNEVASSQALTAVVDDRLAVFQRHVDQALQQMGNLAASSSSSSGGSSTQDVAKVTKLIKKSQETILVNQKQYASALRQTVIRLHEETQSHVSTSADATDPATSSSDASDWEDAKQVILSSHDELRESHVENMMEQKNYLVECIELSQQSILNMLTTMDINNAGVEERVAADVERIQVQATAAILDRMDQAMARRQRWSSSANSDEGETTGMLSNVASAARGVLSGSNDASAINKGFVGDEMEELVLGAMEKLEEAMVANCEQIQAQATAVILDKVETSQKTVEDKIDHSKGVILNKMIKSQSILVETSGSGHAAVVDTLENNQVAL
mmetsp:Transcript_32008/g.52880  ORF Transcript_32008/g.52880 Transcript_32008/m.52880 type:complete len:417 (-) Transcript_32008:138-1388(-)